MRKIFNLVLVCAITATMFAGCGSTDESSSADELTPASSVSLDQNQSGELKNRTPYKLYFINDQGKLAPETRYIDSAEAVKGQENLATVLVKELISGPAKGSLLQATIPQETKVHSSVIIKEGIATVDLSKDFIDKHKGGKKNEQLTLYSIVNTLTELKEIKSVQFQIDGKVKKEFKGSYQLDGAFPRSAYLNSSQSEEQDVMKLDGSGTPKGDNISDAEIKQNNKGKNNIEKGNQGSSNPGKGNIEKGNPEKSSPEKMNPEKGSMEKSNPDNNSNGGNLKQDLNNTKEKPLKDNNSDSDVKTNSEPLE